jgi:hypothetical protein
MTVAARRHAWTFVLSSLLLVGIGGGCHCGDSKIKPVLTCHPNDGCKTDQDCVDLKGHPAAGMPDPDPMNWTCRADISLCIQKTKACNDSGDCCPGQTCNTSINICTDNSVACTMDDPSACSVKGQYCDPTLGSFPSGPGCTFHTCNANADCMNGLSCFNGYCVGEPPCRGGCPSGSVCTPANNACYKLKTDDTGAPAPTVDPSCKITCPDGNILVFNDGSNVFNTCNPGVVNTCEKDKGNALACACIPLPPIHSDDLSRYSSSALAGDSILVSAYDGDHGDLVMHTYTKGDATTPITFVKTEWIDGLPTAGAVTGDPKGPRGGRADPGPDVGQYTSIAFDPTSSTTHISYYAVRDGNTVLGDLRYASRVGTGAWTIQTVDGSDASGVDTGDVGMYSNLVLSPDGSPVITYFQKGGAGSTTLQTAVKVARAKTPQPASPGDWTITTVDVGTRAGPPCGGSCAANEQCAHDMTAPNGVCQKSAAKATDCASGCTSSQFCGLDASSAPVCYMTLAASGLASLPDGNGLFPSIAYLDDKPVVVWYDHADGQLKGVIATADSATQGAAFNPADIQVLDDGASPASTRRDDVGRFTSLAIGPADAPSRIAVTYFDSTAKQLRLLTAQAGWQMVNTPDQRVVDDGTKDGNSDPVLFVGSDSSVKFFGSNISVVYQDATQGNLRVADQATPTDKVTYRQTVATAGACGFYAKQLIDGTSRFATHAIIKANTANGVVVSGNQLGVLRLP